MIIDVSDDADWRRSGSATGLLRQFNDAGVIESADVLVAQRLTELADEPDERVALAVALTVRAVRGGSVCIDLAQIAEQADVPTLGWPAPADFVAAVSASPLCADPPVLHLEDGLLYLDR